MRFCEDCGRSMRRETATGAVVFRCYCGRAEKGAPEDARLASLVMGSTETTEMFRRLIDSAPHDRVNQQMRRLCRGCGRDYMTLVRVGESETTIYKCQCGREESGADPDAAPVTRRQGGD
jgi:DNA-directed RNA polymerase subunit M/transcription elongation factor TFIIS